MEDLLRLIVRNLGRDRRRTVLTVLSIATTVFLLVALVAVYDTLTFAINDPGARQVLGIQERNSVRGELPLAYVDRVRATEGVASVLPWSTVAARLESLVRIQGIATDARALPSVMPPVVEGVREEEYADFQSTHQGVLMGRRLMEAYDWQLGDTIELLGGSIATDFSVQIMGVLEFPLLADNFFMHDAYFQSLLDAACGCRQSGSVDTIFFLIAEAPLVPVVERRIQERFAGQPVDIELITVVDYVGSLLAQSGDISTLVLALALVISVATLLVLGNTLAMAARERTRDLAVMRALGFGGPQVAAVVIGEALALCLAGSLLGGLGAFGGFHFTGFSLDMGPQSYFTVGQAAVLQTVLVVILIGFLAGLPAALRAVRIDVVTTLRGVG